MELVGESGDELHGWVLHIGVSGPLAGRVLDGMVEKETSGGVVLFDEVSLVREEGTGIGTRVTIRAIHYSGIPLPDPNPLATPQLILRKYLRIHI